MTGAKDRPWHMRAWSGMRAGSWCSTLWRHGFRVSPTRVPMATILGGISLFNSALSGLQVLRYGRRIRATQLEGEPIFVVGHWRAGTTLLHELLVLDPQFTYPNTFACFSPNHFLISEKWLKPMIGMFLPRQRPMDNMAIGWNLPQEDEWALCNMGLPSPYLKIMFPNLPMQDREYLTLRELSAAKRQEWQQRFHWFLQALTLREAKPIVLKTPVHTARLAALLEIFPQARFIHITRHPFDVFPSTLHTWKRMYRYHGLQVPQYANLKEEILETFAEMYAAFTQDRQRLKPEQLFEVRYEAVASDPLGQLESIYHHFQLPIHPSVRERWNDYARRADSYQTNRYQLSNQQKSHIAERWSAYFDDYGYERQS